MPDEQVLQQELDEAENILNNARSLFAARAGIQSVDAVVNFLEASREDLSETLVGLETAYSEIDELIIDLLAKGMAFQRLKGE